MALKLFHLVQNTAIAAAGTAITHGLRDLVGGVETAVMPDVVFAVPKSDNGCFPYVSTSLIPYSATVTVGHSDAGNARNFDILMMRVHSIMSTFAGDAGFSVDIVLDASTRLAPATTPWTLTAFNKDFDCSPSGMCYLTFVEDGALNITLSVYLDAARSALIASGTRNGTGAMTLTPATGHSFAGTIGVTQNGAAVTDATITIAVQRFGTAQNKYSHGAKAISISNAGTNNDALLTQANVLQIPTFAWCVPKASLGAIDRSSGVTTTPLATGNLQYINGSGAPANHDLFTWFLPTIFTATSATQKYIEVRQNVAVTGGTPDVYNPLLLENGVSVAPDIVIPISKNNQATCVWFVATAMGTGNISVDHGDGANVRNADIVYMRIPSILREI